MLNVGVDWRAVAQAVCRLCTISFHGFNLTHVKRCQVGHLGQFRRYWKCLGMHRRDGDATVRVKSGGSHGVVGYLACDTWWS